MGVGLGWVGLGWVGLGWVGLGWVGKGWVGLDWVGFGWVGFGWVGWVELDGAGFVWDGSFVPLINVHTVDDSFKVQQSGLLTIPAIPAWTHKGTTMGKKSSRSLNISITSVF